MESSSIELQQGGDGVMEVPEVGGDLLVELLDASLAAEDAGGPQLGFAADVDGGDCWIGSHELNGAIHTHQDCEDCDLDAILSDFEEYGSPRPRYPAPYAVFDDDAALEWAETADAGMGPFAGGCMGDWYMDGMVMAMEWEDGGGEGSAFSFGPCYGGEAGAEQVYGSPLWECRTCGLVSTCQYSVDVLSTQQMCAALPPVTNTTTADPGLNFVVF